MCDVDEEAVVAAVDAPSIYDIPKVLHSEGLDAYVVRRLGLPFRDVDWTAWDELLRRVHRPADEVTVALVGKYTDLPDAYLSVTEALRAGGFANDARVTLRWVTSDDCATPDGAARELADVDAVCVPGGFGVRGIEGKLGAIRYARENGIPTLGLCLGLQCMVIEYARNGRRPRGRQLRRVRAGDAASGHRDDGVAGRRRRGQGRHGRDDAARPLHGSSARRVAGARGVRRRPASTSGTGTATRSTTPTASSSRRPGWSSPARPPTSGSSSSSSCRADVHPWFVGTQAHPEFRSRPTRAHPLFAGLIAAALRRQAETRLELPVTVTA